MSETPRTDAEAFDVDDGGKHYPVSVVRTAFARTLETELSAALGRIAWVEAERDAAILMRNGLNTLLEAREGPDDPDCVNRGSEKQTECAAAGCGFCRAAELERDALRYRYAKENLRIGETERDFHSDCHCDFNDWNDAAIDAHLPERSL